MLETRVFWVCGTVVCIGKWVLYYMCTDSVVWYVWPACDGPWGSRPHGSVSCLNSTTSRLREPAAAACFHAGAWYVASVIILIPETHAWGLKWKSQTEWFWPTNTQCNIELRKANRNLPQEVGKELVQTAGLLRQTKSCLRKSCLRSWPGGGRPGEGTFWHLLIHDLRIWQDAFRMAGAVQETCSSELLGGPGADFLRGVAFWNITSSVFGRWFCVTGAALRMTWHHNGITFSWHAQHFRQMEWKNRKTHWYEAVSSALHFPFWKDVSQNCFVLDVVNIKTWGSLAELLRFWRCQVQKLRKSRRIAAFFDVVKFKNWGSLAE